MKTISVNLYKSIVTVVLSIIASCLSAQYVTIPDANFATYLNAVIPSAMKGNQMDTTNSAVTGLSRISVENRGITDLTGIQYFTSLITLDCGNTYPIIDTNRIDSIRHLPLTLDSLICGNTLLKNIDSLPAPLVYMVCYNNQLSKLPSLPKGLRYLDCDGNGAIGSLPVLDSALTFLNCLYNGLSSLPALPDSLKSIECSANKLSSLPVLPPSLTYLSCNNNVLGGLPALPRSLSYLSCYGNVLPALPALDSALITLICANNQLPVLPTLPDSLQILKCYNNQLPVLPVLPNTLNYLDCSYNYLPALPALSTSLQTLICANNQLPVLPSLPSLLYYLDCHVNQLPVLPALPGNLSYLDCSQNQLPVLPALPPSLNNLNCSANILPSLPALPGSLQYLDCSANQLSKGLPTLPASLNTLVCIYDSLVSLPALPASLYKLSCSSNQLTNLPLLPNGLGYLWCTNNNIACFPVFPLTLIDTNGINIAGNPFHCLPNYVHAMDKTTLAYPLCSLGNSCGCPTAKGVVGFTYKDMNSDCKKDSGDMNVINVPIDIFNNQNNWQGLTYTASNGVYDFPDSAGTYTVVADTIGMPFEVQCPHPGADSVVTINGIDTNVNFSFTCKSGFDLGVQSIVTYGLPFPGTQHRVNVLAGDVSQWYGLNCAKGDSGTVKIQIWGPVKYAGPAAGAMVPMVTGNVFTYSIADFGAVNNKTDFGILLNTDTAAKAGDSICIDVLVTPLADNNPDNNKYRYCYPVVNSHDPNIKTVYPVNVVEHWKGWFVYTVYFQNTGSAAAQNILVVDTLDSKLNPETFELINYSNTNTVHLKDNVLNVNFPNINLPDSSANLKGSTGFIQYRIKPKKGVLFIGKVIKNTGYIYFDFNAPVITNTTLNTVVEDIATSVNTIQTDNSVTIYPNPSNGVFNIEITNYELGITNMEVYNIMGEKVYESALHSAQTELNLSDKPQGIYFYRVVTDKSALVSSGRFVIEK